MAAACAARQALPPDSATAAEAPADADRTRAIFAERRAAIADEPCLGPGDLVEISVFRWTDMQAFRARVSSAGTISLPILGTIQAAGLTESQLRERIAAGLRASILRDPQVSVFVAEHLSQQVSVTGAVARPGLYSLTRDTRTVSDLLSEAGGYSDQAGGKVLLYPADAAGSGCNGTGRRASRPDAKPTGTPIEIDLNEAYAPQDNPLNLPVVGGDAIVVNRGRFLVDGWVRTPGAYDITPGMTAFGGLSAAGGAMYPADLSEVTVWRTQRDGTKKRIDVDCNAITGGRAKDLTLEAGDVIKVPASTTKLVPYSAYWVVTNVVKVGAGLSLAAY